jgi:hypothetical protein
MYKTTGCLSIFTATSIKPGTSLSGAMLTTSKLGGMIFFIEEVTTSLEGGAEEHAVNSTESANNKNDLNNVVFTLFLTPII